MMIGVRVLFFDLFCLCGLWGAPEAARAFCELVFRMVLVPGLTSGHGVMYTESGDHRGATFELFQVLRSRTCGLCCRQLPDGVGTNVRLETARRAGDLLFAWYWSPDSLAVVGRCIQSVGTSSVRLLSFFGCCGVVRAGSAVSSCCTSVKPHGAKYRTPSESLYFSLYWSRGSLATMGRCIQSVGTIPVRGCDF